LFKELKECFNFFDADKNGSISTDELKKLFEKLEFQLDESQIQDMMQKMDKVFETIWPYLFIDLLFSKYRMDLVK
jgi:Ca2+-binding EF-hand superfamily protein